MIYNCSQCIYMRKCVFCVRIWKSLLLLLFFFLGFVFGLRFCIGITFWGYFYDFLSPVILYKDHGSPSPFSSSLLSWVPLSLGWGTWKEKKRRKMIVVTVVATAALNWNLSLKTQSSLLWEETRKWWDSYENSVSLGGKEQNYT